jgi:hypothetical protein
MPEDDYSGHTLEKNHATTCQDANLKDVSNMKRLSGAEKPTSCSYQAVFDVPFRCLAKEICLCHVRSSMKMRETRTT